MSHPKLLVVSLVCSSYYGPALPFLRLLRLQFEAP